MDRSERLKKIADEVAQGEVSFPTNARVALQLQRQLEDTDCHIDTATQLIRAEPLLAAKVVALANSVAYNPAGRQITDVRTAVGRLGFRTIRTLAAAVVARQLAGVPSLAHHQLATALWEYTAQVAALAHVLARQVTHQDPETALFAGIVHEVGSFYLISRAEEYPEVLEPGEAEWGASGERDVGRAVLRVLGIPEPVLAAIEVCWQGYLALPPVTLGDTLLLAAELAPAASPLHKPLQGGADVLAGSIELALGDHTLAGILAESAVTVDSLTAALRF